jgi:hypothetical protein
MACFDQVHNVSGANLLVDQYWLTTMASQSASQNYERLPLDGTDTRMVRPWSHGAEFSAP